MSDAESGSMSTQKVGKTPSSASSLPRPVIPAPRAQYPPIQPLGNGSGFGVNSGIGLGYASAMQHQRDRAASHSSAVGANSGTFSIMDRVASGGQQGLKRGMRTSRRESFRPRASVDGVGAWAPSESSGSRYAGFSGSSVKEEEEY